MLKRLAFLATEQPAARLRLDHFFNRNGFPHEEETKAILRAALASADADLQQEARDWANRLVASGYVSFESILPVRTWPLPTVEVVEPIKSVSEPTVPTTAQPQMLLDRLVVEGFKVAPFAEPGTRHLQCVRWGQWQWQDQHFGSTRSPWCCCIQGSDTRNLDGAQRPPSACAPLQTAFQPHDLRRLITLAAHGGNGVLYQLGSILRTKVVHGGESFQSGWRTRTEQVLCRSARTCLMFNAEGKSQRIAGAGTNGNLCQHGCIAKP